MRALPTSVGRALTAVSPSVLRDWIAGRNGLRHPLSQVAGYLFPRRAEIYSCESRHWAPARLAFFS